MSAENPIRNSLEQSYRREHGRIVGVLLRVLGDLDRAEDVAHAAYIRGLEAWPSRGVPSNPGAWLTAVAKRIAIDELRKRTNHAETDERILREAATGYDLVNGRKRENLSDPYELLGAWPDERLRLIFGCCHPSLSTEGQIALTLKELCGLTTAEIAGAFLVAESTMAQRLVRAKRMIRKTGVFEVPDGVEIYRRLETVYSIIYLIFNEGYSATSGDALMRIDLCEDAIFLSDVLTSDLRRRRIPHPGLAALRALMFFTHARRNARTDANGAAIPLIEQDHSLWDGSLMERGNQLLETAAAYYASGSDANVEYVVKAKIQAEYVNGPIEPDWPAIIDLYDELLEVEPTVVVLLNRSVAVGMAYGGKAGIEALDAIDASEIGDYPYYHSTYAYFLDETGETEAARARYKQALNHTANNVERDFLMRKIAKLPGS